MSQSNSTTSLILPGLLGPWPAGLRTEFRSQLAQKPHLQEFFQTLLANQQFIAQETAGLDTELVKSIYPSTATLSKNKQTDTNLDTADITSSTYVRSEVSMAAIRWQAESAKNIPDIAKSTLPLFCADPVHMQAEMHGARVHDSSVLEISDAEAATLSESFNSLFGEDGYQWVLFNNRGYLFSDQTIQINTLPLSESTDLDLLEWGFTGKDHAQYQKYATEWQMWLYQHPVNQQRRQTGKLPISAVWLWGEGKSPADMRQTLPKGLTLYCQLEQASNILTGLANSLAIEPQPLSALANTNTANQTKLIIDDRLAKPAAALELEYWFERLEAMAIELKPVLETGTVTKLIVPHQRSYMRRSFVQNLTNQFKQLITRRKSTDKVDIIEHIAWR